jgi:hypothetical protein
MTSEGYDKAQRKNDTIENIQNHQFGFQVLGKGSQSEPVPFFQR